MQTPSKDVLDKTFSSDPDGVDLAEYPALPDEGIWRYICQLLSDMTTNYERNSPEWALYDECAERAHDLCIYLHIPYGDPDAEE